MRNLCFLAFLLAFSGTGFASFEVMASGLGIGGSSEISPAILIFAGAIIVVLVAWTLYRLSRRGPSIGKPVKDDKPDAGEGPELPEEAEKEELHAGNPSGKLESYSPEGQLDIEVNQKPSSEPETEQELGKKLGNSTKAEENYEESPIADSPTKKAKSAKKKKPKKSSNAGLKKRAMKAKK